MFYFLQRRESQQRRAKRRHACDALAGRAARRNVINGQSALFSAPLLISPELQMTISRMIFACDIYCLKGAGSNPIITEYWSQADT